MNPSVPSAIEPATADGCTLTGAAARYCRRSVDLQRVCSALCRD